MTNPPETPPPLRVEQALTRVTQRHLLEGRKEPEVTYVQWPAHLGSLAVKRICFQDTRTDENEITKAIKDGFGISYEIRDPRAAHEVRQRTLAWFDWLVQDTHFPYYAATYIDLAATAAECGDADTVRQIVQDPKRLWLNKSPTAPTGESSSGQFDHLSTVSLGWQLNEMVKLMAFAPRENEAQVQAAILPALEGGINAFVERSIFAESAIVSRIYAGLRETGGPQSLALADKLVAALPFTPASLDLIVHWAQFYKELELTASRLIGQHRQKARLAEQQLAEFLEPHGKRNIIAYPEINGHPNPTASQPIAAAIVDKIPTKNNDGTSAIETSAAYIALASPSRGSTVHGTILGCVRTLTGNSQFAFADPKFGFSARFENESNEPTHSLVTVVDANLPEGRIEIDLSSESLQVYGGCEETRFLCGIIQAEKNRRATAQAAD